MNKNKIELTGILSDGYGIIPKKLMKMNIDKYIKLILAYMLSYSGGKNNCFPKIKMICKDLHISPNRVIDSINKAIELGLLKKEKKYPNNPLKHENRYILTLFEDKNFDNPENIEDDNYENIEVNNPENIEDDKMYLNKNKFNKNIDNIYSKKNINDSKESLKLFNKNDSIETKEKLIPEIENILKEIVSIGNFKTRFPEENKGILSGVLKKARNYLWSFKKASFDTDYNFDPKWTKRNNINFGYQYDTWDDVLKECKKAARRYQQMKEDGYYPINKKKLTNSIADWFYNPFTHNSWFLYCLYNAPKTLKNKNGENVGKKIFDLKSDEGKRDYDTSLKLLEPGWSEFSFWNKVKELQIWYNKYSHALKLCNQGKWLTECSTFSEFLVNFIEFRDFWRKEVGDWTIGHFGYGNRTWKRVVEWFKKNKDIDLEPKDILDVIDQYEFKGGKVNNSDIIRKELE